MRPDLDWQNHSACKGHHQIFEPVPFGTRETNHGKARTNAALALCRTCPVINQCAHWALHYYDDDETVIGGMTGPDRRRQRRTLGLAKPARILLAAPCGHINLTGICGRCRPAGKATA